MHEGEVRGWAGERRVIHPHAALRRPYANVTLQAPSCVLCCACHSLHVQASFSQLDLDHNGR